VLADSRLKRSQQVALAAKRANDIRGAINHSTTRQSKEGTIPLHLVLVRSHLEHCEEFWTSQLKKDVKEHESIQRRATKLVKGLEAMS